MDKRKRQVERKTGSGGIALITVTPKGSLVRANVRAKESERNLGLGVVRVKTENRPYSESGEKTVVQGSLYGVVGGMGKSPNCPNPIIDTHPYLYENQERCTVLHQSARLTA